MFVRLKHIEKKYLFFWIFIILTVPYIFWNLVINVAGFFIVADSDKISAAIRMTGAGSNVLEEYYKKNNNLPTANDGRLNLSDEKLLDIIDKTYLISGDYPEPEGWLPIDPFSSGIQHEEKIKLKVHGRKRSRIITVEGLPLRYCIFVERSMPFVLNKDIIGIVVSNGPDGDVDISCKELYEIDSAKLYENYLNNNLYDPTNGLTSDGDIAAHISRRIYN